MSSPVSDQGIEALALIATEWFKAARRIHKLTLESAPGRLERERAQLSFSERLVQDTLNAFDIRLVTYDGSGYSAQLPAEPVNPEDFTSEEGLVVSETLEPTILHHGKVVLRGRVVLAEGK